jgi:hypothetical protein
MRKSMSLVIFLVSLLTVSCGGGMAQRTDELLGREQQAMSDTELREYYQQLGDQLARESRAARTSSGAKGETGIGENVDLLRQRWNEVRQELRSRDPLQP